MWFPMLRGMQIGFFVAMLLALVPACSRQAPPVEGPEVKWGQKVTGTVTYGGKPVPFGFVQFYSLEMMASKAGEAPAAATAIIQQGGKYEIPNAPEGPMMVCVVTDPDTDPAEFLKPNFAEKFDPAKGPPEKGMLPPDKGPPMPGKEKKMPGPDKKGLPKELSPPKMPNPLAEKLSEQEKQVLRSIHAKYGDSKAPKLNYLVRPGEQVFDIKLVK